MAHHVDAAQDRAFGLQLLGIAAHAYMDTFSHYGFSGIGSAYNDVDGDTIETFGVKNPEMKRYIEDKRLGFMDKYGLRRIASGLFEAASGGLGHGGVSTYPDRPFLHWLVKFEKDRPGNGRVSDRDNPATYLEGAERLHDYLSRFARRQYCDAVTIDFAAFSDVIEKILRFEGNKDARIERWREAIGSGQIYRPRTGEAEVRYDEAEWEDEKSRFHTLATSTAGIDLPAYRFHQAAARHRYYVLKELLPKHGIAVY